MVAVNHTPRLAHTQTAFVWRFLALSAGESQIAKRVAVARPVVLLYLQPVFAREKPMHNKTTPDAAAAALTTLMHALIDISVIADRAHKHATSETEYAGAFVPHSLAVMQLSADMALNEAKAILIADCENGGGGYA